MKSIQTNVSLHMEEYLRSEVLINSLKTTSNINSEETFQLAISNNLNQEKPSTSRFLHIMDLEMK